MKLFSIFVLALSCCFMYSCKKEGSYFPNNDLKSVDTSTAAYSFTALEAVPASIRVGEVVDIYAKASGKNLTYTWSSSHAVLFGSGQHVQSSADPCCVGKNKIWCTVSDGVNTKTQEIVFTVTL